MDVSTYFAGKIIDHILRNQAFTPPATVYLSAHSADPGSTGASEVGTAGSNGYARQALALNAASAKATANTSQIQITMPSNLSAGTPAPWLGVWDAATAGNFMLRSPILGTNFEVNVVASTDLFTVSGGHGFATDDRVAFEPGNIGPSLPTGITAGVIYYVLAASLTSTAFKVSTTSGGGALDVTADGECVVRKLSVQTFNASNILQVAAGALTFGL